MTHTFTCKENKRLDAFLTECLDVPRNQVTQLLKSHGARVNGAKVTKAGYKLQEADCVQICVLEKEPSETYRVDFDIPVIYEDEHILVINKPPFLTIHPAPSVKEATVVDWLKAKGISLSTLSGEERHGIVHRIDKETSGALVIAKSNAAHLSLAAQLENKSMGRYYVALIDLPLKENCVVERPIARNPKNRLKMGIVESGRHAKSAFCTLALGKNEKTQLIAAKLFTGRTHQIRVHLESLSRHILGDDLYGFKSQKAKIPRVMLHAYGLYLTHPVSNEAMQFCAPLYEDFKTQLTNNFAMEQLDEALEIHTLSRRFDTASEWLSKGTDPS